jgi:L-fuculose-phosphate aldolase
MTTELNRQDLVRSPAIADMRARIARIGGFMFDRQLTDAGGGNISSRVGDLVCISPRYSGAKYQWQLRPEDVLVVDLDANILDGTGQLSRESKVHLGLHREFGEHGTAVIHAHARNILVYAALNMPMPTVLEGTRKFGTIPVVGYAPAHSAHLATNVAGGIRPQVERISKHAAGVIAPWHGLFLMGKDLDAAFDAVERLDTNAYVILMSQFAHMGTALAEQQQAMEDAIANFKE